VSSTEHDREKSVHAHYQPSNNNTIPSRDEFGDVIAEYDIGRGSWMGLAWDGEFMWGINYDDSRLIGVNREGEITEEMDIEELIEDEEIAGFTGLCWDGEAFWMGSIDSNELYCVDRQGNLITRFDIEGEGDGAFGVAWDGEYLWYIHADGDAMLRQISVEGEIIREVDCQHIGLHEEGLVYWGIVWVSAHEGGQMWILDDEEQTICQLNLDEDRAELIQETEIPQSAHFIAHDGFNLWYATNEEGWFIIDDGIEEGGRPEIVIEPNVIEENLNSGDIAEHVINVSNNGDMRLCFNIEHEIMNEPDIDYDRRSVRKTNIGNIRRDDLGDILGEFHWQRAGLNRIKKAHYDFENGVMGILTNSGWIGAVEFDENYENFEMAWEIRSQLNSPGTFFIRNGVFYVPESRGNSCFRYDAEGNNINGNLEIPVRPSAMSYDFYNEQLFVYSEPEDGEIVVFEFINDTSVEEIGRIALRGVEGLPDDFDTRGLVWVSGHREGQLWVNNRRVATGEIMQILVNKNTLDIEDILVQFNPPIGNGNSGLAHDGANLWWCSQNQEGFIIIDDGAEEEYSGLLDYEPEFGELAAGEDLDVIVILDATDLVEGQYDARLVFLSNDPINPEVEVNISLQVAGVPNIQVEWSEDAGFPDEINWNLFYPDLFTGYEYAIPVEITNTGTAPLIIESIDCDNGLFSANPENLEIEDWETVEVLIILNADEDAHHEGTVIISSNADNNAELPIRVTGETEQPPHLIVEPDLLTPNLPENVSEQCTIELMNDGETELNWWSDSEIVFEPDEDLQYVRRTVGLVDFTGYPHRDNPGEIIDQFSWDRAPVNSYKQGITWDYNNNWMWLVVGSWICAVDPANDYEVIIEFQAHVPLVQGAAWLEGVLYISTVWQNSRLISRWDAEGNSLGNLNIPITANDITASQQEDLLISISEQQGRAIHFYTINGDQVEEIGRLAYNVDQFGGTSRSLCWVDAHPDGQLWIGTRGRAWQVLIDIEDWEILEIVQDWEKPGRMDSDGIGHDGENLWIGAYNSQYYFIIDDGIIEYSWLAWDPREGIIEPAENEDVIVTINSTNLPYGVYEADLHIFSNDPENPDVVVSVVLHVEPNFVENENPTLLIYSLSPAYPNPFNSTTIIKYTVPIIADVNVGVYDVSGRLVQTLINKQKSMGVHNVVWDSANHAAGVYIVQMKVGSFRSSQKLTLVK